MKFNQLVQKRMVLLIILCVIFFGYFGGSPPIGLNKTVNWAWDVNNWLFFAKSYSWLLYIIGYGFLAVNRYTTQKELSKLHLILIVLTFLFEDLFAIGPIWLLGLHLISLLVFLTNMVWSIKNGKKKVNSN